MSRCGCGLAHWGRNGLFLRLCTCRERPPEIAFEQCTEMIKGDIPRWLRYCKLDGLVSTPHRSIPAQVDSGTVESNTTM